MRILAVTNIYPTPHSPSAGTFIEQQIKGLRNIGLEVDVMLLDRRKKGVVEYAVLPKLVVSRIREFQPDIVHAMYGGVMAYQVTRVVKHKPTVVTFHGSDLLGERLSGTIRKVVSSIGIRASISAARRANGVIAVSEVLRRRLPSDIDPSKVRVIPCGIDLSLFTPMDRHESRERLGWERDKFYVLFPSNSGDPVKRPDLARAAVTELAQKGVRAEMRYLRGVPYTEVPLWLNASDVLLLTSLHEGSPTVVKEAMACNVPIVSVDVGDVRERIQEVRGCHIARSEPEELALKLFEVSGSPARIQGRERIAALALEPIALRLQEFYSWILNSRQGGSLIQRS